MAIQTPERFPGVIEDSDLTSRWPRDPIFTLIERTLSEDGQEPPSAPPQADHQPQTPPRDEVWPPHHAGRIDRHRRALLTISGEI